MSSVEFCKHVKFEDKDDRKDNRTGTQGPPGPAGPQGPKGDTVPPEGLVHKEFKAFKVHQALMEHRSDQVLAQ